MGGAWPQNWRFLSTLSLRRATHRTVNIQSPTAFLSTLSLRRATIMFTGILAHHAHFYPRSPCGERQYQQLCQYSRQDFYPRSPCGERLRLMYFWPCGLLFLSTLSLRRATLAFQAVGALPYYFYPRSPCGERHWADSSYDLSDIISIHALLAESDFPALDNIFKLLTFLSTLSLRRATLNRRFRAVQHSFLSTLSLRRATHKTHRSASSLPSFLSTLSLRRATC